MISKRIRNGLLALAAPLLLAASPAMASKDTPTIGVVVPTLDAQFWNNYIDFMKKGAKELGVNLIVLNADNKPDQMVKSLEDLVAQIRRWHHLHPLLGDRRSRLDPRQGRQHSGHPHG